MIRQKSCSGAFTCSSVHLAKCGSSSVTRIASGSVKPAFQKCDGTIPEPRPLGSNLTGALGMVSVALQNFNHFVADISLDKDIAVFYRTPHPTF
jgi:hypothetical protein